MANKRMFSKQITTSDAFMEMPVSSQLLYFHLNMEADDDGFVSNPKRVIRIINVNEDDFKVLVAKRFILVFSSGVIVIKHWLLHNAVRKDMYKETQYLDEKNSLILKDNNVYTELCNESVTSPLHRLDKTRLDKIRLDKNKGEFENVILNDEDYQKLTERFTEQNTKILIEELSTYLKQNGKDKYKSHYATLLSWGRRKIQTYQQNNKPKRTIV